VNAQQTIASRLPAVLVLTAGLAAALAGCERMQQDLEAFNQRLAAQFNGEDAPAATPPADGDATAEAFDRQSVPEPLHLLLPHEVRIHPFTGTRTFDEAGGVRGLDVRVEAKDAYGDMTKAFGDFRFELYAFRANSPDPKGRRLMVWRESLLDPKDNLMHWGGMVARRYQFRLQWDQPIPVGRKLVLTVTFTSPFTERLTDEHVFVSGQ